MQSEDSNKFKEIITAIAEVYNKPFAKAELKTWWHLFKPYSIEQFEQAVFNHMSCPDEGKFKPTPAHIMKMITGDSKQIAQSIEDQAELAWQVVEGEIRRVGSWGSLKMEDKQALAAVKAIGGWQKLCSLTTDKMTWAHKEFVAAYQNYERTPAHALPDKLPGRVALENHKAEQSQGLKHITDGIQAYRNKNGIEDKS